MGERMHTAEDKQIAEMRACGDLRSCRDCDNVVPYAFSNRSWPGYAARCGMWTVKPRVCPQGYVGDRGPYAAGQLEAMSQEHLFQEMDRAYGQQASVVDNGGSDDASYRAEGRCKHVEQELSARRLTDEYWNRATGSATDAG